MSELAFIDNIATAIREAVAGGFKVTITVRPDWSTEVERVPVAVMHLGSRQACLLGLLTFIERDGGEPPTAGSLARLTGIEQPNVLTSLRSMASRGIVRQVGRRRPMRWQVAA